MLASRYFLLCALCVMCIAPSIAWAVPSSGGIISGSVMDNGGTPVANATVRATNSAGIDRSTTTATNGGFRFEELPLGVYTLRAAKEGYAPTILTDVPVISGSESITTLVLSSPSMTSIKALGQIIVIAGSKKFNTGIASINTINGSQFTDQGQVSVQRVLDQTPGIVTGHPLSDPAVPSAFTFPNIRGGLSYETAQLIDGHPVTSGFAGHFFNNNLATYAIDDVELVKGPGATAPEVNYAINGSVNYRTKEPTRTPTFSIDYGYDSEDGSFINLLASQRLPDSKLSYVLSYYSFGSDGPFHNQQTNTYLLFPGYSVNGQAIASFPIGFNAPPGTVNSFALTNVSAFIGNYPVTGSTLIRSELLKLRYDLSPASRLTAGIIGSQQNSNYNGTYAPEYTNVPFTPGAGYTGPIPPGPQQLFAPSSVDPSSPQVSSQPLYELEFDTRVRNDTILLRYYETVGTFYQNTAPTGNSPLIATYPIYGTLSLCPKGSTLDPAGSGNCGPSGGPYTVAPVPTTFNGQSAQLTIPSVPSSAVIVDRLGGASLQYNHAAGPNLYTLAYEKNAQDSIFDDTFGSTTFHIIPPGSEQRFTTTMLRASLNPSDRVQYVLANYFNTYHFDYVDTFGGLGFKHSDSTYDASRVGIGYHPNHNISWRFALGQSVAPPFLNLLSNTATPPFFSSTPFRSYSERSSNGMLKPETAFSIDLGQDVKFANTESLFSWDLYRTELRNQFLTSTVQAGTFNDGINGPAPLYITSNGNLGKARYEGVEFGLRRDPSAGLGYILQGALMRAYPYDLPSGFYNLPGQPLSTNLGIIPGINFTAAGLENYPIPYSQGYIEANYRFPAGITANIGETYYGNNNSFAVPAFFVGNANVHIPFSSHTSFQVSVDNLFDVHGGKFSVNNAGIPSPLANGDVQLNVLNPQGPPIVRFIVHHDFGR
jgi:outer membrane receptor protein involved in Fe transport